MGRYRGELELEANEQPWSDIYHDLLGRGYQLRERYHPDWYPSWLKPGSVTSSLYADDALSVFHRHAIDATCSRTGNFVMLKEVVLDEPELDILKYVGSYELSGDPRNHCVELVDYFDHPSKPGWGIVVTPRLDRVFPVYSSEFNCLGDVMEFVGQTLEGLDFMHEHDIGHRDIAMPNIMMHSAGWLSETYDTVYSWRERPTKPRSAVEVKYYFIDFGLSSQYSSFEAREKEVQGWGRFQDAPELSRTVPYDAFALDVWCLGRVFSDEITQKYQELDFLEPLVHQMTLGDPNERPTAHEALRLFLKIQQTVSKDIRRIKLCRKGGIHWKYLPNRWMGMYKYRGWASKLESGAKAAR